jgi:NAD(P)-dependent dehydrogenase (short-subunit alcohol dehydrogenase family)
MVLKSSPIDSSGRTVLVTGASTGLGRSIALHLSSLGFSVLGSVRTEADGEKLAAEATGGALDYLILDVTDPDSIAAAADRVAARVGEAGLWALVNNAGICISAPLEVVSADLLRHQLEVNVIGQLAVTQAFLPLLRTSGGRLVNMTSGLGTVAIPYLGPYSTAQFAKEGMSDALRRELQPMGVKVSVISPGAVWTPIWGKIASEGERALAAAPPQVRKLYQGTFLRFLEGNEQSARASKTTPADVAQAVGDAVTAARPRTRYRVGKDVVQGAFLARILPDAAIDAMFRKIVTPDPATREAEHVNH